MEETENIWHPEQKVACSNLRNLQFTRIFSEQWLCFFPIIFVALLAEVEKRLATILFSGGLTGTRASAHARGAMYARCLRGFVLGRRRLILVRQSPFVVEGNCEGGREDERKEGGVTGEIQGMAAVCTALHSLGRQVLKKVL